VNLSNSTNWVTRFWKIVARDCCERLLRKTIAKDCGERLLAKECGERLLEVLGYAD